MKLNSNFFLARFSKTNKPIPISISISISILVIAVAISIAAGFYIVSRTIEAEKSITHLENENIESVMLLSNASRALWELRFALPNYVTEGLENRDKIKKDYSKWQGIIQLSFEEYEKLNQANFEIEMINKFKKNFGEYIKFRPKYFELVDKGKVSEANTYRLKYTKPVAGKSVEALDELIQHQHVEAEQEVASARVALGKTKQMMSLYFFTESLLCLGLLVAFNRSKNKSEESLMKLANSSKMAALGEVSAGIAHEINNPLAIIAGVNSLIKSSLERENPNIQEIIKMTSKIDKIVKRAAAIVKSLSNFSRNADQDAMEYRSLEYLIDETLIFFHEKFIKNSILLEMNIENSAMFAIKCREVQLSQVFVNLLNNSFDVIKNMPSPWIKIEASYTSTSVIIKIIDSGNGIPEHVRNKIFQPFFTTKEVGKGTGIGLGISKRIIEEHEGTLDLEESMVNTCFVIKLPITKLEINMDFDKAIKAHSIWKQRLAEYLKNPDYSLKVSDVALDNKCDLGKWIYSDGQKFSTFPEFNTLITEHAKFHKCASIIIEQADLGKSVTEETMIGSESEFSKASSRVVNSLMKMKSTNNSNSV